MDRELEEQEWYEEKQRQEQLEWERAMDELAYAEVPEFKVN